MNQKSIGIGLLGIIVGVGVSQFFTTPSPAIEPDTPTIIHQTIIDDGEHIIPPTQETAPSGCTYDIYERSIKIHPACLIAATDELLDYRFVDIIEEHWDDIAGFSDSYDEKKDTFTYHTARPLWKDPAKQTMSDYWHERIQDTFMTPPVSDTPMLHLDWDEWSLLAMHLYSYFVTGRDITKYGECSQRNYYVAALSIDKKLVGPGEEFNVNKRVAYRLGYCQAGDSDNVFFGGVCGAATQIFRIGLLHPDIDIIEREPHQIRYSQYYGDTIGGDDAGIAQFYKNLTIKNTSNYPLYFKYNDKTPNEYVELIAISPTQYYAPLATTITKQQLGPLEAQVTSISTIAEQKNIPRIFHSTYREINTDLVR